MSGGWAAGDRDRRGQSRAHDTPPTCLKSSIAPHAFPQHSLQGTPGLVAIPILPPPALHAHPLATHPPATGTLHVLVF